MHDSLTFDQTGELSEQSKRDILQDAGLFVSDPSSYPNLSLRMDPGQGLDLSFQPKAYNTTATTGVKVRCSVCSHRQPHNHGFIVRLKSGDVGLVGRDCGQNHFFGPDGWIQLEAIARIASDQAIFARRWGPAKAALEKVVPLARQWAARLGELNDIQRSFRAALPDLFDAIRYRLREGKLTTDKKIIVPYRAENGEIKERVDFVSTVVCTIEADWFFGDFDFRREVLGQVRVLELAAAALHSEMQSKEVIEVERKIKTARSKMTDVALAQAQIAQFLSATTWDALAKWARAESVSPANYRFKSGRLKCSDSDFDYGSFSLVAAPSGLEELWIQVRDSWPRL